MGFAGFYQIIQFDPELLTTCGQRGAKVKHRFAEIAAELILADEARFRHWLREERAERERIEPEARDWQERIEREQKPLAHTSGRSTKKPVADLQRSGELLRLAADIRPLISEVRAAAQARSCRGSFWTT